LCSHADDKFQARLTLKKWKDVEISLDQITGLILAFFRGNTSSLTDLGQEYKWCQGMITSGARQATQWAALDVESHASQKLCRGGR